MRVIVAGTAIMVLMLSSVLWGKGVSKSSLDFAVMDSARLRCNIHQSSVGAWYLRVMAEDANKNSIFDYLYSVRRDLKTSKRDCKAWLKAVNAQRDSIWAQEFAHVGDLPKAKTSPRK